MAALRHSRLGLGPTGLHVEPNDALQILRFGLCIGSTTVSHYERELDDAGRSTSFPYGIPGMTVQSPHPASASCRRMTAKLHSAVSFGFRVFNLI